MRLVYAPEAIPIQNVQSIFLVGPSPRSAEVPSWRPEAIQELEDQGFKGIVYIPETRDGKWKHSYLDQVEWEFAALTSASAIIAWVPRDLKTLPGFTTNVEFGYWVTSGHLFYGRPEGAAKTRYLDHVYQRATNRDHHDNLKSLVADVLTFLE